MDDASIERVLSDCERELAAGAAPDLRAKGFWRAVAAVKRSPALVARFAERIGEIDRRTMRRRVRFAFPADVGIGLVNVAILISLVLLGVAMWAGHPWREILVLAGAAGLNAATHGLAHLVVGTLVGIAFTDWFVDFPKPPPRGLPGFKVDYASYLRAAPRSRAWMHAAGAIVTKLMPFLVLPYALAIETDLWAIWAILAVGVIQIATDALFSVRASDWKKFRREMSLARSS